MRKDTNGAAWRRPPRRGAATRRGWLVVAAASLLALALTSPADATPRWLYPNLVPRPAGRMQYEVDPNSGDARMLLRFDAFVANAGPGPLEIVASAPSVENGRPVMTDVHQRVYEHSDRTGAYLDLPSRPGEYVFYESAPSHLHWHFAKAERYALIDPTGHAPDLLSPKEEAGFCLTDDQQFLSSAPATPLYPFSFNNGCQRQNPNATSVTEGITPGWVDFYSFDLDYQWIDVSDTQPGHYLLRTIPDPSNLIAETNENDNVDPTQDTSVTIPGYLAQPADVNATPLVSTSVELPYSQYSSANPPWTTGAPEFTITTGPSHGRLDQPTGAGFSASSVTYTPDPGFTGTDTFAFSVRDSRSGFPRVPAAATVTVNVGVPFG